ncbi:MAG TPA: hypothetical protein ENH97_03475 [bacterium]|nr:hypothetical protein [bacterium]
MQGLSGAEKLGYGKGYKYAHNYEEGYVKQEYLPKKVKYYQPTEHGYEARIKKRLEEWEKVIRDKPRTFEQEQKMDTKKDAG